MCLMHDFVGTLFFLYMRERFHLQDKQIDFYF